MAKPQSKGFLFLQLILKPSQKCFMMKALMCLIGAALACTGCKFALHGVLLLPTLTRVL